MEHLKTYEGFSGNARKGRIEKDFKSDVESDVQKVLDLIDKGFVITDDGNAVEHKEGGYMNISKRVKNYLIKHGYIE